MEIMIGLLACRCSQKFSSNPPWRECVPETFGIQDAGNSNSLNFWSIATIRMKDGTDDDNQLAEWKADTMDLALRRLRRAVVNAYQTPFTLLGHLPPVRLRVVRTIYLCISLSDTLEEQAGWLLGLEIIGLSLCAIYFVGGRSWVAHFAFGVCLILVSVPWPDGLEDLVIRGLTRLATSVTVASLNLFHIAATQHGNLIEL